ncbi:MAG: PLP-dependent aminotransferase family protein [Bacillota bacterium]
MANAPFADRLKNMSGNVIREILKLIQQPDMISFGGGMPSSDAFPMDEVKEIISEIIGSADTNILQYSSSEGYQPLREFIAGWLGEKGIRATADEVLILSGSQQGIDLAAKAFLNTGDKVIVENPTYLAALQIFKTYEAQFTIAEVDSEGVSIDSLKQALSKEQDAAKLLYLVPTFQNPTGLTMSETRRKEVINLVKDYNITVVEDDPYGSLNYTGESIPALKSFDQNGQSVYLGSFSKIISPGLRVGYAVAPKEILNKMIIGKQATDVHTSNLSQMIVYEFCKRGLLEPHINKIIAAYKEKRDLMLKCMEEYFPAEVTWTKPAGGLFIWARLPEGVSSTDLLQQAVKEKVAFIPGNSFYATGGGENTIRLNFSNASKADIEKGIQKLGGVINNYLQSK